MVVFILDPFEPKAQAAQLKILTRHKNKKKASVRSNNLACHDLANKSVVVVLILNPFKPKTQAASNIG